ncbi:MAG TPA: M1 family metallopeptidase [Anaerolineales bacterium]|jgi:hypothetical protein
MKTRLSTILSSGLLFLISSCSVPQLPFITTLQAASPSPGAPSSGAMVTIQPTITASLTPVGTGLPLPASPQGTAPAAASQGVIPKYVIDAKMDYDAHSLEVQQVIEYPNTSGVEIQDVLLAVQPNMIPGVFSLRDLRVDDVQVGNFDLSGQRLYWKLDSPLMPGKNISIRIEYQLVLPEVVQGDANVIRPQIFGVTARQVNLTDWYPMIVPFEPGIGWRLADAWFYGEHLVYPLANFDVTLKFSDPANAPVVAASAEAEPVENGNHYVLEGARDFVLAMGRQFLVYTTLSDDVTVASYYYPGSESAGQAVLDASVNALKTYSGLFGPYRHKSLAAVQGDFNDGMEFDGLYYLSNSFYNLYDGSSNNYLVMVAAHETSHQWWFGQVASDQANQPWMDESLATYCEELFYEKNYPDSVNWWWSYRIDFYQPEGKIDGNVPSYGGFTPYTNATYRLGARFLDELRQATGDKVFFEFLKDYATRMAGKIAKPQDFFHILGEHTSADLGVLYAKYFANPLQK